MTLATAGVATVEVKLWTPPALGFTTSPNTAFWAVFVGGPKISAAYAAAGARPAIQVSDTREMQAARLRRAEYETPIGSPKARDADKETSAEPQFRREEPRFRTSL